MMGDVNESLPTGDALDDGWIADAMTLAQEFASSWSLVGGRFDDGTMLLSAEQRKSELRACLAAAALRSRQQVAEGVAKDAERWQFLRRKVCIIQRSGFMGTVADRYADFEFINVPMPTYMAPDAAAELDAVIDNAIIEAKYNELESNRNSAGKIGG